MAVHFLESGAHETMCAEPHRAGTRYIAQGNDRFSGEINGWPEVAVGGRRRPDVHRMTACHQPGDVVVKRPFAPAAWKVVPNGDLHRVTSAIRQRLQSDTALS